MYRHLKNCTDCLNTQLLHSQLLPRSAELLQVLTHLDEREKSYMRRQFLISAWNRGSTQVLSQLQRANVLTMTEYIYNQFEIIPKNDSATSFMLDLESEEINRQRDESVQLILNDLLETEMILLADLVANLGCSHAVGLKITETLKECFRRLIVDIYTNPALVQNNYLRDLNKFISNEQMELVRLLHWSVFEELESCSVLDAISKQQVWNAEFSKQSSQSLIAIMLDVSNDITKFLVFLVELFKSPNGFTGWRWWMHFWSLLVSQESVCDQIFTVIRQNLKEMFRLFLDTKLDGWFYTMILCARQTCKYADNRFDTYAKWYKKSIGEMQYGINRDEFRRTMHTLTKLIKYETDMDILEVHTNTAVSAPAYCGDLVLSFKQISKSWLHDLKEGKGRLYLEKADNDINNIQQCVVIV